MTGGKCKTLPVHEEVTRCAHRVGVMGGACHSTTPNAGLAADFQTMELRGVAAVFATEAHQLVGDGSASLHSAVQALQVCCCGGLHRGCKVGIASLKIHRWLAFAHSVLIGPILVVAGFRCRLHARLEACHCRRLALEAALTGAVFSASPEACLDARNLDLAKAAGLAHPFPDGVWMAAVNMQIHTVNLDVTRQRQRCRLVVLAIGSLVQAQTVLCVECMSYAVQSKVVRLAQIAGPVIARPAATPHTRLTLDLETGNPFIRASLPAGDTIAHCRDRVAAGACAPEAAQLGLGKGRVGLMTLGHRSAQRSDVREDLASTPDQVVTRGASEFATICAGQSIAPHARLATDAKTTKRRVSRAIDAAQAGELVLDRHASSLLLRQAAHACRVWFRKIDRRGNDASVGFHHSALALRHHGFLDVTCRKGIALTIHLQVVSFACGAFAVAKPALAPNTRLPCHLAAKDSRVGAAVGTCQAGERICQRGATLVCL
mmetsp:Transcript_111376/g.265735  ORF Transcript_111376/g.265735 Transcript_111376/m.265735 type:complete len:489 (+) Transcript_111376:1836-3302(+)